MTESRHESPHVSQLRTADFDYELPHELIAQTPLAKRDASRLLVLERGPGTLTHTHVSELGQWLRSGDLLVVNNSRVLPSRLRGTRLPGGGSVELLLLRKEGGAWLALGKPAKRLRPGTALEFPAHQSGHDPLPGKIVDNLGEGNVLVDLGDVSSVALGPYGTTPLPPYITHTLVDDERYQTVYNKEPGSAAAPTAGLHFTSELLDRLVQKGIAHAEITLHVGLDTFRPVTADRIQDHEIHREWFHVPLEASEAIARARVSGGRIIAVGTTVARTLETIGPQWSDVALREVSGMTDTFIVPGHEWTLVNGLLTNFHLPRSSLLMLVSALATRESIQRAYAEAIKARYRFFSFGDAMLIL